MNKHIFFFLHLSKPINMTYPNPEQILPPPMFDPPCVENPINSSQIHEYNILDALNDVKDLLKEQILLLRSLQKDPYPIGSLYMTTKQDNPSTYFGGKWTLYKILDKKDGDDYIFKRIE